MNERSEPRSDPRQWLRFIWRRRWLLLSVVVLVPALIYGVSSLLPKSYEATNSLRAQTGTIGAGLFAGQLPVTPPSNEATVELIGTTDVSTVVAEELDVTPAEADGFVDQVTAQVDEQASGPAGQTEFFSVAARASNPRRAAEIANAFAEAISQVRTQQSVDTIDETIKTLRRQAAPSDASENATEEELVTQREFARQLQQLRALRASQQSTTQIVEAATPPGAPASPKPVRNAAIGLVLALLLASALVPILRSLDRRVHQVPEIEELMGSSILAQIPEDAFPGHLPRPHVKEAFQTLRANLTYFNVDKSVASVLVASPGQGDGKTTVALNLAVALAEAGGHVVMVDADLRRSSLARRVGVGSEYGLDSVLLGETSAEEALIDVPGVEGGRLRLLGSASSVPNPSVLLGSEKMRTVLAELTEIADIVVIDTPAILAVSDAVPLISQVSGILVVARLEQTTRDGLTRTREVIATARGKLLGVVAAGTRPSVFDRYEYGYYGYYDTAEASTNGARKNGRLLRPFRRVLPQRSSDPNKTES